MNDIQQSSGAVEIGNIEHRTPNVERRSLAILAWIKNFFDYMGGSREEPPTGAAFFASPIWVGIWWGLLIGLILLFCGQTSKFIYIDF